jgi:hypothetical protein
MILWDRPGTLSEFHLLTSNFPANLAIARPKNIRNPHK